MGGLQESNRPVGQLQRFHALELAQVVGYECQPFAAGMGCDVQVIDTNSLPLLFQSAANAAVMLRRLGSVRQHLQTGANSLPLSCQGNSVAEIRVRQTNAFLRTYKKLFNNQKNVVDQAVTDIVREPIGGVYKPQ